MRVRRTAVLAILVVVAGAALWAQAALADAGPFMCTSATDFISPRDQLNTMQETASGAPTNLTPLGSSPFGYNALGFDPVNGYLYAVGTPPHSPDLLRFDQAGAVTDLGPIAGLPQPTDRQYVTGRSRSTTRGCSGFWPNLIRNSPMRST